MVALRRILVVEDDQDIRESLLEVLEMEGYDVATACNGREGLAALENGEPPCMILLDLMMPVMNGLEFLAAKQKTAFSDIPVVVISAAGEKMLSSAAVEHIKKPINLSHLLRTIEQLCGGHSSGETSLP